MGENTKYVPFVFSLKDVMYELFMTSIIIHRICFSAAFIFISTGIQSSKNNPYFKENMPFIDGAYMKTKEEVN